jgi:hypothetical protein
VTARELAIPRTVTKPKAGRVWGLLKGAMLLTVGLPLVLVPALLEGGVNYSEE